MNQPLESEEKRDQKSPAPPRVPSGEPTCLKCGKTMRLAHVTPDDNNDKVEIRGFACECGAELLQIVDLRKPARP